MIHCNTLNAKLPNSQLNKLKLGIKNGTEVISSNVVGGYNDENNFLDKLLLNNTHKFQSFLKLLQMVPQLKKLSKTQLHKIGQSRGFLGRLLGLLLKTGLPLKKCT